MSATAHLLPQLLDEEVERANTRLRDGIRFAYFGRDTESGSARVVKYDTHGEIGLVAVGTPRECWLFLRGVNETLDTIGR